MTAGTALALVILIVIIVAVIIIMRCPPATEDERDQMADDWDQ